MKWPENVRCQTVIISTATLRTLQATLQATLRTLQATLRTLQAIEYLHCFNMDLPLVVCVVQDSNRETLDKHQTTLTKFVSTRTVLYALEIYTAPVVKYCTTF